MDSTEASSYNIWRETIKFFNTKVGQEFTRQEFFGRVKRFGNFSMDSRDTYRLLLQKAEYVKTVGRGRYQIIKEIPNVSLVVMRDFVGKQSPIAWFKYASGLESYLEARGKK